MNRSSAAKNIEGEQFVVDLELLKKYNVAGPRYTSYPTALHFDEGVGAPTVKRRLVEQLDRSRPMSLYFHLPFCRKLCWYCACTKIITGDRSKSAAYLEQLQKELALKDEITRERQAVQMHFGGGTPTFLSADEIRQLGQSIHERVDFHPDAEISVEIDPREFDPDKARALADVGFNRASLGVQDSNPVVQKAINRIQPMDQNRQTISWLRETGIESVNLDLIYGLPHQTLESFEKTLDDVLELEPNRFAIYSYAHVPWVNPAQQHLERTGLPSADLKLRLLKLAIERLCAEGYVYIGMDHFARPDDELARAQRTGELQRNFQGYSTWGGTEIMAYGMSAISQSEDMYFQNFKDIDDYRGALEGDQWPVFRGVVLTDEDRIRRRVIMEVMCRAEVDYAALSDELGIDFVSYFAEDLAAMDGLEQDGLVRRQDCRLEISEKGRLFIRNIAMNFDGYLKNVNKGSRTYSKTV